MSKVQGNVHNVPKMCPNFGHIMDKLGSDFLKEESVQKSFIWSHFGHFIKARKTFEVVLQKGEASRNTLKIAIEDAGISTKDNGLAHMLMEAELQGMICSGSGQNYDLTERRVTTSKDIKGDEALAELAKRYFQSHGPATERDFAWWSGFGLTPVRKAIADLGNHIYSEKIKNQIFYWSGEVSPSDKQSHLFALPAFDEYYLAYADRSFLIQDDFEKRAASSNGIFWPLLLKNGKVTGTWKRTIQGKKVLITPDFFTTPSDSDLKKFETKAKRFGKFLEKEYQLH